jgi:nucleoside-diphosphate-sugar epimerase
VITVLGASGFIGSHVVAHLQGAGLEFRAPARDEPLTGRNLGHVLYCIGLTADFRQRPWDAVEAHVCKLLDVVRHCTFESILYLSSTRLYIRNTGPAREDDLLSMQPAHFEDIYNLSKATGESIVLSLGAKGRVARPSNVYGQGQRHSFIAMVLDEAATGTITFHSALASARDYVSVEDVAALLVKIALHGKERIYNVGSGIQVSNEELANALGCPATVAPGAPAMKFPPLDTERIRTEFGFVPAHVLDDLPSLLRRRA